MRERHFPRLCRSCDAPMARQEDTCWSCEAAWGDRSATRSAWRAIPADHAARADGRRQLPAPAVLTMARAVVQARLDVDRWADEGGSLAAEVSRSVGARIAAVQ
jgi:hypothetical protein